MKPNSVQAVSAKPVVTAAPKDLFTNSDSLYLSHLYETLESFLVEEVADTCVHWETFFNDSMRCLEANAPFPEAQLEHMFTKVKVNLCRHLR